MTKIKICGITRLEDAQLCAELGVEYVGFVFVRESTRFVEAEGVGEMARASREPDEGPLRVGVFRDSPLDEVHRVAEIARLDMIQLHGSEDEEYVRAIGLPVIKVVDAGATSNAPYVLFDSGGGTGRTFDWSLVDRRRSTQPFFLAGGLTAENVAEAIRATGPFAVDVSSGVEASPGIKDPHKLRDFVQKVRQP